MPDIADPKWLLTLFKVAEKKKWCTKIFCTTCTAGYFRDQLNKHLGVAPRQSVVDAILGVTDDEIATLDKEKTFWATGLVFYEIGLFSPYGHAYANMPEEIRGTWAEAFFTRIQPEIDRHNRKKGYL